MTRKVMPADSTRPGNRYKLPSEASDRGSVPGGLLLLVEHFYQAAGRLLVQPGRQGRGPETVVAKAATKVGERLEVSSRDGADLEPDGEGAHPVGGRLVKVPGRLAQATRSV
jgi:hypothetical protein